MGDVELSPALSQVVSSPGPVAGRKIGVVADAGSGLSGIAKLRDAAEAVGVKVHVIAGVGGELRKTDRTEFVERTFATARSIEFDAVVIAHRTEPITDLKAVVLLQEAYRHCKVIGAWGTGEATLANGGIPSDAAGVVLGDRMVKAYIADLCTAIGLHRGWDRVDTLQHASIPSMA